ncbi:MAG: hypothetical protein LC808_16880 [Actinobacteria bacterium]|nr:hypothetical protein [Actinomycetota bacterium]
MTDARFPERWLNDRRMLRLSDAGFRLFVTSLAWSVSNRTDGALLDDDLSLLAYTDSNRVAELARAGLWERRPNGWQIVDFAVTQTTAAQLAGLDHKRVMDRERQAQHRSKAKMDSSSPVTRDRTRDTEDRTGKDRPGEEENTTSNETDVWLDVRPPGSGLRPVPDPPLPDETWRSLAPGYDH